MIYPYFLSYSRPAPKVTKTPKLGEFGPPIIHTAAYMVKNNREHNIFCLLAASNPAEVVYRAKVRKVGILPYDLPHL